MKKANAIIFVFSYILSHTEDAVQTCIESSIVWMKTMTKTCCCCFSLRTGCMIIGVLGVLVSLALIGTEIPCPLIIVDFVSNALLILGAALEKRFCLLPSMILGIITNILLWVMALIALFASATLAYFVDKYIGGVSRGTPRGLIPELDEIGTDADSVQSFANGLLFVFVAIFVLAAIIHALILRVIFGHFSELREERLRGQTQHRQLPMYISSETLVVHPIQPTGPYYYNGPIAPRAPEELAPPYSEEQTFDSTTDLIK